MDRGIRHGGLSTIPLVGALGLAVAVSSCGLLPKKVKKADCEAWADKFAEVMKEAADEQLKKCASKLEYVGGDSAKGEKAGRKAINAEIDETRKSLVDGCATQEGKSYVARDAECYLAAKKLKDWGACTFKTPFFTDFSEMAGKFEANFQKDCDEGLADIKKKAKSKGDDEEAAPKVKAPKAPDDDTPKPKKRKKATEEEEE